MLHSLLSFFKSVHWSYNVAMEIENTGTTVAEILQQVLLGNTLLLDPGYHVFNKAVLMSVL